MNIMGSVCGSICPTKYCMGKCTRQRLDIPINIPGIQAEIARRAHKNGKFFNLIKQPVPTGKRVAVVGAGPSGLSCAACLISRGHKVDVYERNSKPGGDTLYIPKFRFPQELLSYDVDFIKRLGDVEFKMNTNFEKPMESNYDAVCYAIGMQKDVFPPCSGSELCISARQFLTLPKEQLTGKRVAVLGCGAVAIDCASLSIKSGAEIALIIYRRTLSEARLASEERGTIEALGISIIPRTEIKSIEKNGEKISLNTVQVNKGLAPIEGTEQVWAQFDYVVSALGQKSEISGNEEKSPVFVCGQARGVGTSVVCSSASGKNAAKRIHAFLSGNEIPIIENDLKSDFPVFIPNVRPVPIDIEFDGITAPSPFIVASSPFTDSIENCRRLLKEGWGGVVLAIGEPKESGFLKVYHKNPSIPDNYIPSRSLSVVSGDITTLKNEYPNSILSVCISTKLPMFNEILESISQLPISFVQIKIESLDGIQIALSSQEKYLGKMRVEIMPYGLPDHVSKEIIFDGCLNYRDGLRLISQGFKLIEVDPSKYARGHEDIEGLNSGLSISLYQNGYSNLSDFIKSMKQIDIEEPTSERLINALVNPYSCLGCGRCTVCPNDAIDMQPSKWIYNVDPAKCIGCGLCESRCPSMACGLLTKEQAEQKKKH